jgi:hypothetical protein
MLKRDVVLGDEYAFRRNQALGGEFTRVRAVAFSPRSRSKLRVEALDGPSRGEEEWVTLGQLHGPWAEAKERLDGERRLAAVRDEARNGWDPEVDEPVLHAVGVVLGATGEKAGGGLSRHGTEAGLLRLNPTVLDRICARARIPSAISGFCAHAYLNDDVALIPFDGALRLAKTFAAAEPSAVIQHLASLQRRANEYPHAYKIDAEDLAAFGIARSWADDGRLPAEIAERESNRVSAQYAEVLHRVAELGAEHRRLQTDAEAMLGRCVTELRKRNAKRLADDVESCMRRLSRATGQADVR